MMSELLATLFWLAFLALAIHYLLPRRRPSLPAYHPRSATSSSSALYQATIIDPNDHAYSYLPITPLIAHCFDSHFELWNMLGEKDVTIDSWQRQHANEHGLGLSIKRRVDRGGWS